MLSWDDFETEEASKQAAQQATIAAKPAPQPQPAQTAQANAAAPASAAASSSTNANFAAAAQEPGISPALAQARASLANLDPAPGLEELEMGAARIQVDDKRMIDRTKVPGARRRTPRPPIDNNRDGYIPGAALTLNRGCRYGRQTGVYRCRAALRCHTQTR